MSTKRTPLAIVAATPDKISLDLADRLELGARLRRLREATGLTTLQVAEQVLGYKGSHAAVSRLERAVFATLNLSQLDALAQFYGVTRESLLAGTDNSDTAPPPVVDGVWGLNDVAPFVHHRLRDLRQALGLTRTQFAQRLGSQKATHYVLIETGKVTPRPDELLRVAAEFNVSGSWLILGVKARIKEPTQALRVRALRLLKDVSRPALAMEMDPQNFADVRVQISRCENKGAAIPWETVQKLAVAFDVPPEFLDPQNTSREAARASVVTGAADALYAAEQLLPLSTRKLLDQIRTMSALDMFSAEDCAAMLKELSMRTWKRPVRQAA